MIATARWGRKKPHAARLPAFDELVIPHVLHIEDMGGSLTVIVGDDGSCIHLSVTRRAGKTSVIVVEEEGIRR